MNVERMNQLIDLVENDGKPWDFNLYSQCAMPRLRSLIDPVEGSENNYSCSYLAQWLGLKGLVYSQLFYPYYTGTENYMKGDCTRAEWCTFARNIVKEYTNAQNRSD